MKNWMILSAFLLPLWAGDLEKARDTQDRAALEKLSAQFSTTALQKPSDAQAQYQAALALSLIAEVATETGDKGKARSAAETGIKSAQKAVALNGGSAEYHRILGTLCGQVIPANVLAGLKWGNCARDEVEKAVSLDPKAAMNYVSRGVGNYYLPSAVGGGIGKAIQDFEKAAALDPKLADAQQWLGIALRKEGRNREARKALEKAVALNPARIWSKQQLEKTPAK